MNHGIMDVPYSPPITMKRQRVYDRTKKSYSEYTIIGTGDNETVSGNRGIGSNMEADRTDFVIDISKVYKNGNTINSYGSLSLNIPNGTVLNGNKRGAGAVDLQQNRTDKAQVASGDYSFVAGIQNTARDNFSIAIGSQNTSYAMASIAIGSNNYASGLASVALGNANTVTNSYATAFGCANTSSGMYSTTFGYGATNTVHSMLTVASALINSTTQTRIFTGGVQTGDATANVVLRSDNNAPNSTNQLVLLDNSSVVVLGYVIGQVSATSSVCFEIKALVRRGANASVMSLVGTPTVTKLFNDTALAACVCSVAVDTTYGTFSVRVTGIAATTIKWGCTLFVSEVA